MDSVANVAGFGLGGVIAISDGSTSQPTAEYVASVPTFVTASGRRVAHVMPYRRQVQIAANLAAR